MEAQPSFHIARKHGQFAPLNEKAGEPGNVFKNIMFVQRAFQIIFASAASCMI